MIGEKPISPSKLELMEACAHYEGQEYADNSAAEEGTLLHKAVETDCKDDLDGVEQEDLVDRCIMFRDQIAAKYKDPIFLREQRISVEDGGNTLTSGIVDEIIMSAHDPSEADIIDWKFGRAAVTAAEDNIQMLSYGAGTLQKYLELDRVHISLVCPRQDDTSTTTMRREDLPDVLLRIAKIQARAHHPDIKATPTEKACKYCARKAVCGELHTLAMKVSSGLMVPIILDPALIVEPEERAKAQVLSYILEDWAKQVRAANTRAVMEDQEEIPGFDLRVRSGSLKIEDPAQAIPKIMNDLGLPLEAVAACCTVSAAKLTELMAAHLGGTKKQHRDELAETLAGFVAQSDSVTFLQRKRGKTDGEILQEANERQRQRKLNA
jgi:hypothetical protein